MSKAVFAVLSLIFMITHQQVNETNNSTGSNILNVVSVMTNPDGSGQNSTSDGTIPLLLWVYNNTNSTNETNTTNSTNQTNGTNNGICNNYNNSNSSLPPNFPYPPSRGNHVPSIQINFYTIYNFGNSMASPSALNLPQTGIFGNFNSTQIQQFSAILGSLSS